jgi:uncharacterized protein (TIGR02996 family)
MEKRIMTDDERGLLNAIIESPGCGTVRLVYADWLEEHGRLDHARRIRLLVEADQIAGDPDYPYPLDDMVELERKRLMLAEAYKLPDGNPIGDTPAGTSIFMHRGFARTLHCTLAQFMGERCLECGATGMYVHRGVVYSGACAACHGTGTTPGLARTMFGNHPITRVVLTDREPLEFEGRWLWHNANHRLTSSDYDGDTRPADHLPSVIFDRLTGYAERNGRVTEMVKNYPTREAALAAASVAAVDYARELCGHKPIVATE